MRTIDNTSYGLIGSLFGAVLGLSVSLVLSFWWPLIVVTIWASSAFFGQLFPAKHTRGPQPAPWPGFDHGLQ